MLYIYFYNSYLFVMKLKITASLSFSNSIESVFFDSVIGKESQTAPLLMHASNCRNRT